MQNIQSPRPLQVGFDLDGVLLYNPARIVRPVISTVKKILFPKKELRFYYPNTKIEKIMWDLFHKSSLFNATGIDRISELVKEKKIVAYLITARYSFLGHEVLSWIQENNLGQTFASVIYNKDDKQPHLFKENMINTYSLDIYVEDNYDIVEYLRGKTQTEIFWLYNVFDRGISYAPKIPTLQHAIRLIEQRLNKTDVS